MKSVIVSMIAAAGLMVAGSDMAEDGAALLKKSNCMGCHKMEGKLVGPGFKEVAAKYKGDAGAAATLEAKVAKGGAGVWGTMPMPPMSKAKPEDIKEMVAFINLNLFSKWVRKPVYTSFYIYFHSHFFTHGDLHTHTGAYSNCLAYSNFDSSRHQCLLTFAGDCAE